MTDRGYRRLVSEHPAMTPGRDSQRAVTADEIQVYTDDGVVHLKGILPIAWIEQLETPLEETLVDPLVTADLTALGENLATDLGSEPLVDRRTSGGRFLSGVDHWRHHPMFAEFATASPLPEIAGVLMGADYINLYEDSVLVKEPGTAEETAFHQDLGYFHLAGERICATWVPLDRVDIDSGAVAYLRGSHRIGSTYRPNWFVSTDPLPGTQGEPVPKIRPDDDHPDLLRFEVEPGDVVVHHAATLHGAGANRSLSRRRRAISVRYSGNGVCYEIRPGAPLKPHHAEVASGDPVIDHPGCPLVWRNPLAGDEDSC